MKKLGKKRKEAASSLLFNLCVTAFGGAFLINVFENEGKVIYASLGFALATLFCVFGFVFVEEERSE